MRFKDFYEGQKMKQLILMRGISGSGKSTVAQKIKQELGGVVYSTDDYFTDANGRYNFDFQKLHENHIKNKIRTEQGMIEGISPIIIDNMNSKPWEMKDYVLLAQKHGYQVQIRQPGDADFPEVDFDEIMRRQGMRQGNNKMLPPEMVKSMMDKFQKNVSLDDVIASTPPNFDKK